MADLDEAAEVLEAAAQVLVPQGGVIDYRHPVLDVRSNILETEGVAVPAGQVALWCCLVAKATKLADEGELRGVLTFHWTGMKAVPDI